MYSPDPDTPSESEQKGSGQDFAQALGLALNLGADTSPHKSLYQTEKGLSEKEPAGWHQTQAYQRNLSQHLHKNFDFSKLPPGGTAMAKADVEKLAGRSISDTEFANAKAFLDTTAYAEGTSIIGFNANGKQGYDVQVGGKILTDLSHHPREVVPLKGCKPSSAAGRYQFLEGTWDECAGALGLTDFSARSQDIAGLYLSLRNHQLDNILGGRFAAAIDGDRHTWASFQGAGYGQHEYRTADLQNVYRHAGGHVAGEVDPTNSVPMASAPGQGTTQVGDAARDKLLHAAQPPAPETTVAANTSVGQPNPDGRRHDRILALNAAEENKTPSAPDKKLTKISGPAATASV